jgi:hypothetical protein
MEVEVAHLAQMEHQETRDPPERMIRGAGSHGASRGVSQGATIGEGSAGVRVRLNPQETMWKSDRAGSGGLGDSLPKFGGFVMKGRRECVDEKNGGRYYHEPKESAS